MITANQWYNIAQTAQVGTKSGIRIDFGTKYALFKVSVDYGNAVIAAVESNITAEETRLSVRIRYNNSAWFVDVRFSVSQETTLSAATYDNTGWEAVSPNTSVAGNTICIINDLTSLIRPSGGGESLFELMNVGTAEVPRFAVVPKKYNGVEVGIISNTFISMAGFEEPDDDTPVASSSLGDLLDVQITDPKSKDVLTYDEDLRKWVNGPGGLDETALGNYLTTNKYITQDALTGALNGYVTNEIYNTAITALNLRLTELETTFKEWFYYDEDNKAIHTKLSLIVDGTLSMGELGSGGGTEVASGKLADLLDVQIIDPASGQILLYNEEKGLWVNGSAGLNEEQLEAYLKGKDYATNSALSSLQTSVNTLRTDFDNLNALLNGNVGGVIDTWNEVVSFLDGYSQSDDLATILSGMNSDIANRVLIEDFEKLEGSVTEIAGYFTNGSANNALKLGGQLPSYYATADALNGVKNDLTSVSNRVKKFEDIIDIDDNGDVYIKGTRNFYTEGGTISMFGLGEGDSGEVASVSIKFEGSDVLYNPINGVITLPAYPSGGGVADSVAWSNVTGKPDFAAVATSGNYSDLSGVPTSLPASDVYAWAKAATKPSYAFSEITGKPTTLGGYGITDAITTNGFVKRDLSDATWGTLTSANGFTPMYWLDSATGGGIGISDAGGRSFIQVDGDYYANEGRSLVLHTANFSNYALPLSGGTLTGRLYIQGDGTAWMTFKSSTQTFGNIGMNETGPKYWDGSAAYSFIHSGNIGSQSVNYANDSGKLGGTLAERFLRAAVMANASAFDANSMTDDVTIYKPGGDIGSIAASWQNFPTSTAPLGGFSLVNILEGNYRRQIFGSYSSQSLFVRSQYYSNSSIVWNDWKQLAFLDDNVASATKLQTARTIWGQSFDGTGNVNGLMYVVGPALFNNYNASGNNPGASIIINKGDDYFGIGPSSANVANMAFGLCNSSWGWSSEQMVITNTGNVLIGTSYDSGYKLEVNGSIKNNSAIVTNFYGTATCGLYPDSWISGDNPYRLWLYNDNAIAIGSIQVEIHSQGPVIINHKGTDYNEGIRLGNLNGYAYTWSEINFGCDTNVSYGTHAYQWTIGRNGNNNYFVIRNREDDRVCIDLSGNMYLYNNLVVTGTAAMGTLSSSSDARLKDNIELLTEDESLAVLRQLRPSKWNWKSNGALSYGFIAQEVESIASCMVDKMNDEELGQKLYLQYNQLHAFEVGAIQHIDSEVEQLKRDLNTANLKIEKLENKLKQYRLCQ